MKKILFDIAWGDVALLDENDNKKRFYSGKSMNISSFDIGIMPPTLQFLLKGIVMKNLIYFNINYKIAADYDLFAGS